MPKPIDRRPVHVRVSASALLDLVVAAAESAMVPPEFNKRSLELLCRWDQDRKNRSLLTGPLPGCLIFSDTGLEFAGCLTGTKSEDKAEIRYSVERAYPVTAIRGDDFVEQAGLSPALIGDLVAAAGTGWRVLGDVHSHPFIDASPAEIVRRRHFVPSKIDMKGPPFAEYEISLVVTICLTGGRKFDRPNLPGPLYQIRVGDFEVWLFAHTRHARPVVQQLNLVVEDEREAVSDHYSCSKFTRLRIRQRASR